MNNKLKYFESKKNLMKFVSLALKHKYTPKWVKMVIADLAGVSLNKQK